MLPGSLTFVILGMTNVSVFAHLLFGYRQLLCGKFVEVSFERWIIIKA